jgi:hypothetical protein
MPGSKDAPRGWFSRRHESSDAHQAAVLHRHETVNENKAPEPPCGTHHAGQCRLSKNCSLSGGVDR